MCGIAGYNFTGIDKNYFKDNIELVLNLLKNRGPDHKDFWENDQKNCFLLNTRLKIQDLHDRSNMPMVSRCKNFVISYNGEIYNKNLLKKNYLKDIELITNSDTEIILNLYIYYGKKFLNFLDGMFAISIYNIKERSLFLARDPLGIKPLYYAHDKNYLFFSSSIKSFYFKKKINNEALMDFFTFGFIIEPKTILENVKSLESGNFLLYKDSTLIKEKYFNLKEIFNKHNNNIETEIEKSVIKHYTNEVPSCLFLSSGVDSNIILSLLKRNKINVPTISINFENSKYEKNILNEKDIIKKICDKQKIKNYHKFISKYELEEYNSLFYKEMDQPTTDGLNTYIVSKIANQMNFKVAYSGLGGDELFCDYGTLRKIKFVYCVNKLIKIFGIKEILKLLIKKINFKNPKYKNIFDYNEISEIYLLVRSLFSNGEKLEVLNKLITVDNFKRHILPFNDLYLNTSFLEYNIYLKNQLLRDSDWASMANSIELRIPFVNKELISNAFQVKQKITRKDILKKIDNNIWSHVSKKKIGFYTPTYRQTEYHNPLKEKSFTIIKKFIEINNLKN